MKEYIKELMDLNEDIKKRTNEILKKVKPTKNELLDKAIDKIHSYYDGLLDSIEGKKYDIVLNLDLDEKEYSIELCYLNNSRYAYFVEKVFSYEETIINANAYGSMNSAKRLKNDEGEYNEYIIKILTKYHDQIQKQIKEYIEEEISKENLMYSKRISKDVELLNVLEDFIND